MCSNNFWPATLCDIWANITQIKYERISGIAILKGWGRSWLERPLYGEASEDMPRPRPQMQCRLCTDNWVTNTLAHKQVPPAVEPVDQANHGVAPDPVDGQGPSQGPGGQDQGPQVGVMGVHDVAVHGQVGVASVEAGQVHPIKVSSHHNGGLPRTPQMAMHSLGASHVQCLRHSLFTRGRCPFTPVTAWMVNQMRAPTTHTT